MRTFLPAACAMTLVLFVVSARPAEAIQFTSNLLMHFDASNVQVSGSNVTRWYNQGTAGATLDALPTSLSPTRITNVLNGLPVIRFNSAVDGALRTGALGSDVAQPLTILHVGLQTSASGAPFFYDGRVDLKRAAFYNAAATQSSLFAGATLSGTGAPLNAFNSWTSIFNGTQSFINQNGSSFVGPGSVGTQPIDGLTIGSRFATAANRLNGDIAEIAVFTGLLNAAQFKIVSNHYSAKYQLPVATNLYDGDNNGPGGYDFNVFGIGNSGAITGFAAGTVTTGTEGRGLAITSEGSLDVNDFVLAGDKNQANGLTTADVPNGGERWVRVWNIDQTGSVNVELKFDYIAAGLGALDPTDSFELLYSSNDPFNFSVLSDDFTVAGNTVSFSLLGSQLADGFYTLAIAPIPAPEPSTTLLVSLGLCGLAVRRRKAANKA